MNTSIPHDILTISELTRRKNRINSECISVDELVLTDETVKKLRASSSMFNKSTYIQLLHDGHRYNIEHLSKAGGSYRLSVISHDRSAVFKGEIGGKLRLVSTLIF